MTRSVFPFPFSFSFPFSFFTFLYLCFCVSFSLCSFSDVSLSDHSVHSSSVLFASGHRLSLSSGTLSYTLNGEWNAGGFRVLESVEKGKERSALFERATETFIVHFDGPIVKERKEDAELKLGVKLTHYLPHHAYLVHVEVTQLVDAESFVSRALAIEGIDWASEYHPQYKMAANLHPDRLMPLEKKPDRDFTNEVNLESHPEYKPYKHQGIVVIFNRPLPSNESGVVLSRMLAETHAALPECRVWSAHFIEESRAKFIVPYHDDLIKVAEFFATYSSVLSVERQAPFVTKDKWARGILQSGGSAAYKSPNYGSIPMQGTGFFNQLTGKDEIIGMLDTGLDVTNCLFYDSNYFVSQNSYAPFYPNPGNTVTSPIPSSTDLSHRKIVQYITYVDSRDDATSGHGTHTSGTAAGNINGFFTQSTSDLYNFNGIAYDAKIHFTDVGDSSESLSIPSAAYFLSWAYRAGARVHSDSWGSSTIDTTYSSDSVSVDTFLWSQRDMLVIFAAGNDGANGFSTVSSPSTAKNVISVAASLNDYNAWQEGECAVNGGGGYIDSNQCSVSTSFYNKNNLAYFSSMGPTADGRFKPDITAVGYQIASAKSGGYSAIPSCPSESYSKTLKFLSGTSMATPGIAGHAALIRQYFREGWWYSGLKNSSAGFIPSGALVKAVILNAGTVLSGVQDIGCCAYTNGVGSGFSSPYPDSSKGKCCCVDSNCASRVNVAPLQVYRNIISSLPNFMTGFGRPVFNRVLELGADSNFNLLPLLRDPTSVVAYTASTTGLPRSIVAGAKLGDMAISTGVTHEVAVCLYQTSNLAAYPFKVTLVWTDYPGTSSAAFALVNDLNLVVIDSSTGTEHFGNGGATADTLNNAEQVTFTSGVKAGVPYIIRVIGSNVVQSPQPYALVASGPIVTASVSSTSGWDCSNVAAPTLAPATPVATTPTPTSNPIGQALQLIYPLSGATYSLGSTVSIRWNATGSFIGFVVLIKRVSDESIVATIGSPYLNPLTVASPYTIPSNFVTGSYSVVVKSYDTATASLAVNFTISAALISPTVAITAPLFGQVFYTGSDAQISWTYSGLDSRAFIVSYKSTSASLSTSIGTAIASGGVGSYVWSIPSSFIQGSYFISVVAATDSKVSTTADFFWIVSMNGTASTTAALKIFIEFDLDFVYSLASTSASIAQLQSDITASLNMFNSVNQVAIIQVIENTPVFVYAIVPAIDLSLIKNPSGNVPSLAVQNLTIAYMQNVWVNSFANELSFLFNSPVTGHSIRSYANITIVSYCSISSTFVEGNASMCPSAAMSAFPWLMVVLILLAVLFLYSSYKYLKIDSTPKEPRAASQNVPQQLARVGAAVEMHNSDEKEPVPASDDFEGLSAPSNFLEHSMHPALYEPPIPVEQLWLRPPSLAPPALPIQSAIGNVSNYPPPSPREISVSKTPRAYSVVSRLPGALQVPDKTHLVEQSVDVGHSAHGSISVRSPQPIDLGDPRRAYSQKSFLSARKAQTFPTEIAGEPLPDGWSEHKSPQGHAYFFNSVLNKSTYQRPTVANFNELEE